MTEKKAVPQPAPGYYLPLTGDISKFVPQNQIGVDYMLVSPENDTSKRYQLDEKTKKFENMQTPFKNVNTTDLATGNLSPMQSVAGIQLLLMINHCQLVTSYYSTEGKNEKIKYDFSEAHNTLTNFLHSVCTISKAGSPKGGMLLEILKTHVERTTSSIQETLKQQEVEQEKKGLFGGWK
jgi:hypothetical protein